jgi:antitoxin ParD1/3/4
MPMTRKTITLPKPMEDWVKTQIESGRFANDSEYFRDLIRRDQDRQLAVGQLRHMVDEALASGPGDRTIDEIWQAAEERHAKKKNG